MENVLKTSVLASGSKGNSTLITNGKTNILIDIGMVCRYIETELNDCNISPTKIDGIVITHLHTDHIKGLKVFIKKYKTKIYLSSIMYDNLKEIIELDNYEIISSKFKINDIELEAIKLSHDSSDSNGYIITFNNYSIAYVTDTGYLNEKYFNKLKNKEAYIFESNHDVEMLMNNSYPYYLKQRIVGDEGHLSNNDSSLYLSKLIGNKTNYVILIHLSKESNTQKLALYTLENKLEENNIDFKNIYISEQRKRTELM